MNIFKRIYRFFFPLKKKPEQVVKKKELVYGTMNIAAAGDLIIPDEIVETTKQVLSEFQPFKKLEIPFVAPKPRMWRMPNNRLHIQYNSSGRSFKLHGIIQSLRVTKVERARQIVGRIDSSCIRRAIFQDKQGAQFKII